MGDGPDLQALKTVWVKERPCPSTHSPFVEDLPSSAKLERRRQLATIAIIGHHHSLLVTAEHSEHKIVGGLRLTDVFDVVCDAMQEWGAAT